MKKHLSTIISVTIILIVLISYLGSEKSISYSQDMQKDQYVGLTDDNKASANDSVPIDGSIDAPKIYFPETTHDFGSVSQGKKVIYEYIVMNKGNAPLKLIKAKGSWGCTAAVLTETAIPPGGEGKIKVTFDSGHKKGKQNKAITVTSNDPANPTTKLYMKGVVEVEFDFLSSSLRMGNVKKGESVTKTSLLQIRDPKNTKITDITTSSPFITARLLDADSDVENRVKIEITLNPGLPSGRLNESVVVKSNLDSKPEARLRLAGEIMGEVSVTPHSITYVISDSTGVIGGDMKKIIVSNLSDSLPLELIKVEDPDGYLFIKKQTITENQKYDLDCLLLKDKIPEGRRHDGQIIITTNNPSEKEIPIDYKILRRK